MYIHYGAIGKVLSDILKTTNFQLFNR